MGIGTGEPSVPAASLRSCPRATQSSSGGPDLVRGNRLGGARDPGAYDGIALSPNGLSLATLPAIVTSGCAIWLGEMTHASR